MYPSRSPAFTAILFLLIGFLLHAVLPQSGHIQRELEISMLKLPAPIRPAALYKYGQRAASASLNYNYTSLQHRVNLTPALTTIKSLTSSRFASSSASTSTMATSKTFMDAVKDRRSIYALNKKSPISDEKIEQLVKDTVLSVPSFFNTQTTRLVVLLKDEHDKFWDLVSTILKPIVPEDQWEGTAGKLGAFKAGYGTILFYEEPEARLALEKAYPIYAHHMSTWSEHTSAMHQFVLWTGLQAEGFGANLQHYHPIIDAKVAEEWKVPSEWALRAQLVFGGKAGEANEKTFKPVEERVFFHGK